MFACIIFFLIISVVEVIGQCDDPQLVTDWQGQIKSPDYPTYKSGLNCSWLITVAAGNVIKIQFSDFAMSTVFQQDSFAEDCSDASDYTEIFDGNSSSNSLIKKLCGWRRANVMTTQNNVLIYMKTVENHRGFLLDFQGICNTKMTRYKGVIQSPNYPNKYPHSTSCSWVMDFGWGMNVYLFVKHLSIESQPNCTFDYITIHKGINLSAPMIGGHYCGFDSPPPVNVTGPLVLHFVSDTDTEFGGFYAEYIATDRDECVLGHDCSEFALCENTIGSYKCECKSSFRGDGKTCEWFKEVDECLSGENDCSENAACTDTKNLYECACKLGYFGNGKTCADVDECKTDIPSLRHDCHRNATCENLMGSFKCTCSDSYEGNGHICTDKDECLLGIDICHANANCYNTDGSYTCQCGNGFFGDGYNCIDINECKSNQHGCDKNAECTNIIGSYSCACHTGYHGNGLVCLDSDECSNKSHNCHMNANCRNTIGSFICECNAGYYGNGVQCKDSDECSNKTHNCHVNANCRNTFGSFICECNVGYYGNGIQCEDINECVLKTHSCHKNARCENINGNFSCYCNHGYKGNGSHCEDIDECVSSALHNCHVDATCKNVDGSFTCVCNNGYHGNGIDCKDVDECSIETHTCHLDASCTNSKGSYLCSCDRGYKGNGTHCDDVNECLSDFHNCHDDATCTNAKGLFYCHCNQGYEGNGTHCLDVNECRIGTNNCHNESTCVNTNGSFYCICNVGYSGNGTSCFDVDECKAATHNCDHAANCENNEGSFVCSCHMGFKGDGIQCQDVNECETKEHFCDNNAQCTNTIGSYSCSCNNGYLGDNGFLCRDVNECTEGVHICSKDHGECSNTNGSYTCRCKKGFIGDGILCQDSSTIYVFIVSITNLQWTNEMFDSQSKAFKNMKQIIETQVDTFYMTEDGYISSRVQKLVFGSVRAELLIEFHPLHVTLVDKILTAAKRGKLLELNLDKSSFTLHKIGSCLSGCSRYSTCLVIGGDAGECVCNEGYDGDGTTCVDVNECNFRNGGCQQQCFNNDGSFYCKCNEGFILQPDQRTCKVSDGSKNDFYCKDIYDQGIAWPATLVGKSLSLKCPNNNVEGYARRICGSEGRWEAPDLSLCVKPELKKIKQEIFVRNITTVSWVDIKHFLEEITTEVYPALNVLYAGDLIEVYNVLISLIVHFKTQIKNKSIDELQLMLNVLTTTLSYVFDAKHHEAWKGIPQPLMIAEHYLSFITVMSTIFSDRMIEDMKQLSIKQPEHIIKYDLSSRTSEIEVRIFLTELRRFNRTTHVIPSSDSNSTYRVIYPSNMFDIDMENLIKEEGFYKSIGCWADNDLHVRQFSLETKHYLLMDNYLSRKDSVRKCAIAAASFDYDVFALHQNGMCVAGPTLHLTYDKDGEANNCAYGQGSVLENSVYQINNFYTGILTMEHKNLGTLLLMLSSNLPRTTTELDILKELVTMKILKYGRYDALLYPVSVVFNEKISSSLNPKCTQLKHEDSSLTWITDTCTTTILASSVVCNCTQLLHTAVLYNYFLETIKSEDPQDYYTVLSYISFAFTTFCLITTLLTYLCTRNAVEIIFQLNISLMVLLAQSSFILGIAHDKWKLSEAGCKTLLVLFHFIVTSIFSWIFAQSWHSYYKLNALIKKTTPRRLAVYVFLGYGYPGVVLLIGLAIFHESYGNRVDGCWYENTLLVSVAASPIAILVILNIIVLGMVVGVYFSPRTTSETDEQKMQMEKDQFFQVRDNIRACSMLLPITIATWVFAVLVKVNGDTVMKYMFLIFNTLQGLLHFFGFCILNRQTLSKRCCSNEAGTHDYSLDSPSLDNIQMFKMRATVNHAKTNNGLEVSPQINKSVSSNAKRYADIQRHTTTEIMHEMQEKFQGRKRYAQSPAN